jgi:predicted DNA-binding transcriptional regulator AlpA
MPTATEPCLARYVRFRDLVAAGIVYNWPTLLRLIDREGFPVGIWLGPNTRAWRVDEVESWLANRPHADGARRKCADGARRKCEGATAAKPMGAS